MLAELAEGPLDGVALLVRLGVECGRAPAAAAAPVPVAGLVGRLGDGGLDAASSQVSSEGFKSLAAHPCMPRDLRKRVCCPLPGSGLVNFSVNKVNTLLPAHGGFPLR